MNTEWKSWTAEYVPSDERWVARRHGVTQCGFATVETLRFGRAGQASQMRRFGSEAAAQAAADKMNVA